MRALITGADGFVGPHLRDHLVSAGDDVTGTGSSNGPDLLDRRGWVDLVDRIRPEVIYHLAGWSDVGGSWSDPHTTFRVNAEGTMSVLDAVRHADEANSTSTRVIVVSSADTYGVVSPADLPLTEDSPSRPSSPYGASKQAAEALANQYHRGFGVETVIARPFNHIGPGQSPRFVTAAFAARIVDCEAAGGGLVTHGDLSAQRDLTDVRDVVAAYRLLATSGTAGQTYNICSGESVPMSAVLEELIAQSTVAIDTEVDASLLRPVELPVLRGSRDAITTDTGWTPSISLTQSLADVLDSARSRAGSSSDSSASENEATDGASPERKQT